MDEQLEEIVTGLVERVKESQEYREYRRQIFELQKRRDVDLFTEADRLEREFAPLRAEPYVNQYLDAELAICRIVQHINYSLMSEMDFDLGFELY